METMKKTELHCGPLIVARKIGVRSEDVMYSWPSKWHNKKTDRNWLGLPIDTHWHHKAYLKSISKKMLLLDQPEVGAIVLLTFSFLSRHWCEVRSFDGINVEIDLLTGESKWYTYERFKELVKPYPNCMYKIVDGEQELTWFDKLMLKVLK